MVWNGITKERKYMMSAVVDAPLMTTEQLLALPRNGTERWLIQGQLREKPMTVRNRVHSRINDTGQSSLAFAQGCSFSDTHGCQSSKKQHLDAPQGSTANPTSGKGCRMVESFQKMLGICG
jgi:hypothetical protein